jgi:hypothetical protein
MFPVLESNWTHRRPCAAEVTPLPHQTPVVAVPPQLHDLKAAALFCWGARQASASCPSIVSPGEEVKWRWWFRSSSTVVQLHIPLMAASWLGGSGCSVTDSSHPGRSSVVVTDQRSEGCHEDGAHGQRHD